MIHRINTAGTKTQKTYIKPYNQKPERTPSLLTLLMIVDQNEPQI